MNPNEFFRDTTFSVQLAFIAITPYKLTSLWLSQTNDLHSLAFSAKHKTGFLEFKKQTKLRTGCPTKHDSMQDDLNVVLIFYIICCIYFST